MNIIALSSHALKRMFGRYITSDAVLLTLHYGEQIEQDGARLFHLGRRQMPTFLSPAKASRIEGITVVVSRDGVVLTVYRQRDIPRKLRRRGRIGIIPGAAA